MAGCCPRQSRCGDSRAPTSNTTTAGTPDLDGRKEKVINLGSAVLNAFSELASFAEQVTQPNQDLQSERPRQHPQDQKSQQQVPGVVNGDGHEHLVEVVGGPSVGPGSRVRVGARVVAAWEVRNAAVQGLWTEVRIKPVSSANPLMVSGPYFPPSFSVFQLRVTPNVRPNYFVAGIVTMEWLVVFFSTSG